jgi:Rrf2 family nitric oxide-sensitive transcriptional repressor
MRLTKYTDYSLRVMMYLALKYEEGRGATIEEMARAYDISRNHLMKIVNDLAQQGFIETVRGRSGGARLARPPAHISVGTLVRAAEKDFAAVACHESGTEPPCTILPVCNLRNGLRRAMDAFLHELDKMTLQDAITAPTVAASLLGRDATREIVVPLAKVSVRRRASHSTPERVPGARRRRKHASPRP